MTTSPVFTGDFSDAEQPTLGTVASFLADVRTQLQDIVPGYRYDDPSLLVALNVTMLEARRLRPDFFVFNLSNKGQVPAFQAVDDTYILLEPQFRYAIENGVIGHALMRDQEDYQDSRASAFLGLFSTGLVGHTLGSIGGGSPPAGRAR
jgi:hypothetical protein